MSSFILPMHGLGGGGDLPIPASLAIAAGTAALTLSFVVLLLAWRTPRFGDGRGERAVPAALARILDSTGWSLLLRVLGLAFFCFMLWPTLFGPDSLINPIFGVVYVWLWVGLVPASLLFGRFYRAISPIRTLYLLLARATGQPPSQGLREYPARLGYWPAAVGLFAFVWLELVSPDSTYLGPLRLWMALYVAVMVVGSAVYGDRWLERADPFEVYSTLLAHLSPWGRDEGGHLVWVSPLRHLSRIPAEGGLVAVVAVLLGSTAYDSWRDTATWIRFLQGSNISPTDLGHPRSPGRYRHRRRDVRCRVDGHGGGARPSLAGSAAPGPLRRADHRRLHGRPLLQLLRPDRPADPHPAQRPHGRRVRTCSAPLTGR